MGFCHKSRLNIVVNLEVGMMGGSVSKSQVILSGKYALKLLDCNWISKFMKNFTGFLEITVALKSR